METPGYRPVSGVAVAAAIAGMLSAVALASPFFWFVPLVGIAVACLGLADVCRRGAEKAGRVAALLGLALSIGFGTQAITAAATSHLITAGRARSAAERWIEAIGDARTADAESMCQAAATPSVATIASRLAACAAAGFHFQSGGMSEEVPGGYVVRATAPCGNGPITVTIHIVPEPVQRRGQTVERWTISRCDVK